MMQNTWASGAIELIRHADSHIYLATAFDFRIAFISLDNAVETMMRTFLSLPSNKSGIKISRKDIEAVDNSFPGLLNLLWGHVGNRLTGIDDADIEHYHRIRNTLYHNGTGLSVDEQYLTAYRQIAILLLKSLFGITLGEPKPAPTLGHLIMLWNQIELSFRSKLKKIGIDINRTFFWEEAVKHDIINSHDIQDMIELRSIRNKVVHSITVDQKQIERAIELADKLLMKYNENI
jgi:hypothetical protein